MTREEIKEFLPIMQAFADGKKIEYSNDGEDWIETETLTWDTDYVYRIKPNPKYRPFKSQEECWNEMHKHPDFGWVKPIHYDVFLCINSFSNRENKFKVNISNMSMVMEFAFNNYTFTDGAPFGIKQE